MRSFQGRVAAITGAGSGIGRALALALAAHGTRLALSDRDPEKLLETRKQLTGLTPPAPHVHTEVVDVSDRGAVFSWSKAVQNHYGTVNLIINNAGVGLVAPVPDITPEDLEWLLGCNLHGVVNGTQAFLPALVESGEGHVVNVSSIFGIMGLAEQAAYNISKFAIRGFTDALNLEMRLANHPVGVTCVHPGGIRTDIVRASRFAGSDPKAAVEAFEKKLARNSAEYCAMRILSAVRKNRARVLIGADAQLLDLLVRLFPGSYHKLLCALLRLRQPKGN